MSSLRSMLGRPGGVKALEIYIAQRDLQVEALHRENAQLRAAVAHLASRDRRPQPTDRWDE